MSQIRALLAGESWATTGTHVKGFDQFPTTTFHTGADEFLAALKQTEIDVTFLPAHLAQADFPQTAEALADAYDVVILSDIGANTLLLHPNTWLNSERTPNRLHALRDYVAGGGGLAMFGGYLSFQGINGAARFARTAVEEVLPVECLTVDDRIEVPEGFTLALAADTSHPVLADLPGDWPHLLGFNEVRPKQGAEVLATVPGEYGDLPLLVTGTHGKGRSLAWTSDVGPHWLPPEFIAWPGYGPLFANMIRWLAGRS